MISSESNEIETILGRNYQTNMVAFYLKVKKGVCTIFKGRKRIVFEGMDRRDIVNSYFMSLLRMENSLGTSLPAYDF